MPLSNRDQVRLKCKKHLAVVAQYICGFKDVNKETHGDIISCLESSIPRKLICVPRGCLKSSIACVAYPIWRLLRNPDLRILIDSELYSNSANFLRQIRLILESEAITSVFGSFRSNVWNEKEIIIKQRRAKLREGSITVGGISTVRVGQHYDCIIGDDYNSPQNSNTPENAQKVVDHYKYNLSILEPQGEYVIIGTRYSEADLIGHILLNELGIQDTPVSGTYEAA